MAKKTDEEKAADKAAKEAEKQAVKAKAQAEKDEKDAKRAARLQQKGKASDPKKLETTIPEYDPLTQKLFEAPNGHIIVGDKGKRRILYRDGSSGGVMINPLRRSRTNEPIKK